MKARYHYTRAEELLADVEERGAPDQIELLAANAHAQLAAAQMLSEILTEMVRSHAGPAAIDQSLG